MDPPTLRFEIEELYATYVHCLDDGEIERWPELFTTDCIYKIIPRENFERGLPLALVSCEGRGMLEDRVESLRRTAVYAPRAVRHLVSSIRIDGLDGDIIRAQANYAVFQTLAAETTQILNVGKYVDQLVHDAGQLRFKERLCVFDSVLVPGSLVYPI